MQQIITDLLVNSPDFFSTLASSDSIEDLCSSSLPSKSSIPNHRQNSIAVNIVTRSGLIKERCSSLIDTYRIAAERNPSNRYQMSNSLIINNTVIIASQKKRQKKPITYRAWNTSSINVTVTLRQRKTNSQCCLFVSSVALDLEHPIFDFTVRIDYFLSRLSRILSLHKQSLT